MGASFEDVAKLNISVVDYRAESRERVHRVSVRLVARETAPASTLIGVSALAREGCRIEVEAIAVAD